MNLVIKNKYIVVIFSHMQGNLGLVQLAENQKIDSIISSDFNVMKENILIST